MDKRREVFEEKAFTQRFLSSVTRVNDGQFGLHPVGCPTKAESIAKDAEGNYLDNSLNFAWWGFNAALDAVVIELPLAPTPDRAGSQEDYLLDTERRHAVNQCRAAIESTGLGLKVLP